MSDESYVQQLQKEIEVRTADQERTHEWALALQAEIEKRGRRLAELEDEIQRRDARDKIDAQHLHELESKLEEAAAVYGQLETAHGELQTQHKSLEESYLRLESDLRRLEDEFEDLEVSYRRLEALYLQAVPEALEERTQGS